MGILRSVACALLLLPPQAWAQDPPFPLGATREGRSPQGHVTLSYVRTLEAGPRRYVYRLREHGGEERTIHLPFLPQGMAVGDSGLVAGYGNAHGSRGSWGPLGLVVVNRDDELLLEHHIERSSAREFSVGSGAREPDPHGRAVGIDDSAGIVWVLMSHGLPEHDELWGVELGGGELRRIELEPPDAAGDRASSGSSAAWNERSVMAVPGTGLVLVHWMRRAGWIPEGLFALHDFRGRLLWRDGPGRSYRTERGRQAQAQLLELVETQDLMRAGAPPGTFEILSPQDQLRRTYRVTGEPGAWRVEEQGRAVVTLWHEIPHVRARLFPPVASPSGRFTLHWDAVSDDKGTSCEYRLSERDGPERWFQLPLRLESAAVSDEGEVVGFGAEDTSRESPLVLVGVGRELQILFERHVPRRLEPPVEFIHAPLEAFPVARAVAIDEASGEALFLQRTGADRQEELWCVELEDGELRQVTLQWPQSEEDLWSVNGRDLVSVPGTGLVLVHWMARWSPSHVGLHTLHDREGQVVWQADPPQDYGTSRGRDAYPRLLDHIETRGLIRTDGTAGEFRIVDPREQVERTYRVDFEDGRWRVEVVGREVIRFWEALLPKDGAPRMRDLSAR